MQTYWGLNENEIESGYFWEVSTSNPLIDLGVIDKPTIAPTWIWAVFARETKEAEDTGFLEKTWGLLKWVKETVEEPLKEIVEWGFTLVDDIKLLSEWKPEETKGLLWDFFKAWEGRLSKIEELNASIDATWGNMFDKTIWTALNVLWAWVDFTWDVIVSWLKTLAPEWLERATEEWLNNFIKSDFGKGVTEFVKTGWDKLEEFKQTSPEANRLALTIESLLPAAEIVTGWVSVKLWKEIGADIIESGIKAWGDIIETSKEITWEWVDILKEWAGKIKETISDIKLPQKDSDTELLEGLGLVTEKGLINWIEVDIPKIDRSISEKAVKLFIDVSDKQLAGKAVSPRTIWKSAAQKLKSIADVEKNTKKFYDNVRTGLLEWDISTLESAAQTIVDNISTVWARIWNAVKEVDWFVDIDNNLTDDIISALWAKWAEVSPATPILKKFFDSLWDGKLTIEDAYELKKVYSNEVTKLYKSWDAWTKQYKALNDWVKFLNTKIDEIIETNLWDEFANDKLLFRELKTLVDDMVASALVEWRASPFSLAERIWQVESIFSPVNSIKQKLIKTSDDLNKRGWAWEELIKRYDEASIKNLWIK